MRDNTKNNRPQNIYLFIIFICLPMMLLFTVPRFLVPIATAYVLALILKPIKRAFYSVSLSQKMVTFVAILLLSFALFYPLVEGFNAVISEADTIKAYAPKFDDFVKVRFNKINSIVYKNFNYRLDQNIVDSSLAYVKNILKEVVVSLPTIITSVLEWGFLIPLFVFFILKDGVKFKNNFLRFVPNQFVERIYYLMHQFNSKFGDYVFAKFIEAFIVGVVITTGLVIINFPFAFLLGITAAITNIVPYVGPILGMLPAVVLSLMEQDSHAILPVLILYLTANVIDLALVFPLLVSKVVNLHPLVVVISVIVGSQLFGVVGMIIGVPAAAFLKLVLEEIFKLTNSETGPW